ncbi:hypothetical protein WDW89_20095 [Deltaproteobacteria bacterium TL4]
MNLYLAVAILFGIGLVFVFMALQGLRTGMIRAGNAGLVPYRPTRKENPFGFYFYVGVYFFFGGWCLMYGILIALGYVNPIPLK